MSSMSSIVVSEDRSDGRADNPIELDDSSSSSDDDVVSRQSPSRNIAKEENASGNEEGSDSGDDSDNDFDNSNDEEENEDGENEETVEDGDEAKTDTEEENDVDSARSVNESANEEESENANDEDDDEDENDSDDSTENSVTKETDLSAKAAKRVKHLWGNIESMSEIIKSPYEGNECAEVGEDCFEEFRLLLDGSHIDDSTNRRMIELVGDKLARDLYNARQEIGKSGMLYSANWKEGKIRESDFGWIPKRQLLLCLHEHRFAKGNVTVLQAVTKNLDCTKLVLEAMKLWDLMESYPNLASNKNEESFVFGSQKVLCYRCQIFVARAFATLQILNKTEEPQQSLTRKIKKCLDIMNGNVRANQIELARMKRKVQKRKASELSCSDEADVTTSRSSRIRKSESSGSRAKSASSRVQKPKAQNRNIRAQDAPKSNEPTSKHITTKPTRKRRRKIPKREEREESIFMLFNTMHMQVQRLNQMMSFFQSQLQDHRGILREEIRESLDNSKCDKN